jgi:hypothetical protein
VFRVPMATREAERVTRFGDLLSSGAARCIFTGLSPDGSVYVTVDHGDVDVYAIDLKLRWQWQHSGNCNEERGSNVADPVLSASWTLRYTRSCQSIETAKKHYTEIASRRVPPMKRKLILSVMVGMAMLFAQHLNAQTRKKTGATIMGMVLDSDGRPVANASVMCQTSSGMKPRVVHTDKGGKFFITGLKQESYDLRATRSGAYSDWERNMPLRKSQTKDVTLQLLNGNTATSAVPSSKKQ